MAAPRTFRRSLTAVAFAVLAVARPVAAEDLLRVAAGRENESRAVVLAADEVVTWPDAGEQVFLLRGKVLVEQGVFSLRAERAVLWVDARLPPASRVRIVADGSVRVEDGTLRKNAPTVATALLTRQNVNVRQGTKALQQPQGADPFFRRALGLRPPAPPVPQGEGVQLTSATVPAPAVPTQNSSVPILQPPGSTPAGTPLPTVQVPQGPGLIGPVPGPPGPGGQVAPLRNITIQRRSDQPFRLKIFPLPTGEKAGVVDGGIILTVRDARGGVMLDIEADRLVTWTHGDTEQLFERMRGPDGTTTQEVEFYLAGNVEVRSVGPSGSARTGERVLRAEQVYYDVRRNVAVAVDADLQFRRPGLQDDFHLRADELYQVSPTRYEAVQAHIFSSRLPSDPGLELVLARATVEQTKIERRGLFGQTFTDAKTGQPQTYTEQMVHGENVFLELEGLPIFYLPVVHGDANEPFGPLQSIAFRNDRIFGTQVFTTFNVWNLLNRNPEPGTRWTADLDYLSRRGPAAGTTFDYAGRDLFGLTGPYAGQVKLFGIHDDGTDILGGGRGEFDRHPEWRGRVLWDHNQTIDNEYTIQGRLSLLSDKNFLEQYYKLEFDNSINNETYQYFRQQRDQWAYTVLAQEHLQDWLTEVEWLPRVDGYLIGQSFFDLFTYNAWANAGYAQLRTTSVPPPPVYFTDKDDSTGRFAVNQELSLPLYLGPVKFVPYGVLDLAYYSNDLTGEDNGRLYGGGGVRGSMPFSRLYPNVQSDLFNLNGLYHKVVLSGNYLISHSSDRFTSFPQLDRLDDDATDQALRDILPREPFLNPAHGLALQFSPIFNPQRYAIRRLVNDRIDTIDTIEVLQTDIRQRWQTKRGYPGQEHVVDYLTVDLSGSYFPDPSRDNFGKSFAFLEYDTTWNVGDRTAVVSNGWYDPFDNGARVFTVGTQLNRPDRTSFFLGYRMIDPVDSRAVISAATYVFSPKYAITAASVYDFGINQSLANSLIVTRIGSDVTLSFGFTYNALLNNFGFTLQILPNVVAAARTTGASTFGRGLFR